MKNQDSLGEFTAAYNHKWGAHRLDALAGFTVQDNTYSSIGIMAKQFTDNRIPDISATVDPKAVEEYGVSRSEYNLLSYLARVNYSYSNRYSLPCRWFFTFRFQEQMGLLPINLSRLDTFQRAFPEGQAPWNDIQNPWKLGYER